MTKFVTVDVTDRVTGKHVYTWSFDNSILRRTGETALGHAWATVNTFVTGDPTRICLALS